jgi:hypothetical protein
LQGNGFVARLISSSGSSPELTTTMRPSIMSGVIAPSRCPGGQEAERFSPSPVISGVFGRKARNILSKGP